MVLEAFPRPFPLMGCFTDDCTFDLDRREARSLTGSGNPDVAEMAPPAWVGEWSTKLLSREDYATWDAWLTSLRGGLRLFRGRPSKSRWPLAYPRGFGGLTVGGDPFSGLGNLSNIAAGRDVVTINQLPNGFIVKPGDFFSIPVGSRQHIHQILEVATASSNALTTTIEPIIRPGVSTGIAVKLFEAYCDMSLTGPPTKRKAPNGGGMISFMGQQIL
jgi:hypothetical protein